MDKKQSEKKRKSILLFVAGVPSTVNKKEVLSFFSDYGKFNLVSRTTNHPSAKQTSRGYCILACRNAKTVEFILEQKYFQFMDRTLTVKKYVTGVQLIIQNKRTNRFKVIFKKVPIYLTESQFRDEIEALCGTVQTIFRYKNKNPRNAFAQEQIDTKYHVYSVNFLHNQTASCLLQIGNLILKDGSVIIAEKFDFAQTRKKYANIDSNQYEKKTSSIEVHSSKKISQRENQITANLDWHLLSPTQRKYHRCRSERYTGSPLIKTETGPSDIRFNILAPSKSQCPQGSFPVITYE